jgi:cell division protein FtsQ
LNAGDLKMRIQKFVSVYPSLAARFPNRIESIDMRYPNGLALRQRGQSAPASSLKNET